jgi:hypothetical protein
MMHKVKKSVAKVSASGVQSAEYAEYVTKLANLTTYLKASSLALGESERTWKEVCDKQKVFAEAFANKYPDKDQVREFGKTSAAKAQALVKEFVLKTDGATAPHLELDALVQAYLAEIVECQGQFKEIAALNTEMQMYMKKTDELAKAKKVDEAKTARNMEKLEQAKETYEAKLDSVVERMKAVYGKRAIALKASYVAYWSSQLRAFDLLSDSLVETREFVSSSVEPLRNTNIGTVTDADIEAFNATNSVPGGSSKVPTSPIEDTLKDPVVPALSSTSPTANN